jgi:nitrate reductase NapAB chaperone NapD
MFYSGIVVTSKPDRFDQAVSAVSELPGVEIHQKDEASLRFVAVIEAETINAESDLFSKIRFLPDVTDAALVVHRGEDENGKPIALK